jgi:hypothetical protein
LLDDRSIRIWEAQKHVDPDSGFGSGTLLKTVFLWQGGRVLVYGRPGVELSLELEEEGEVAHLLFIPGQGRLLAITAANHIHLIEITEDQRLILAKSHHLEAGLEKKTGFKTKKPSPVGFLGFFYIFAQEREFLGFFQFQEYF